MGAPGAHGAVVAGIQGIGVNTPKAAAVDAATVGFAKELHIPNGIIFTRGILSIMLAMGIFDTTRAWGSTFKTDGATPKEQLHKAPPQTTNPIQNFLSSLFFQTFLFIFLAN
ncbi:MAG: hypothetical protein RSA02_07925 [Bacteroidales bacterium]